MRANYDDITSRIPSPPLWFDEHAVPRYCEFDPSRSASTYVGEVALAEVACQRCKRRFMVAISPVNFLDAPIAEAIHSRSLDFGDPPDHLHVANGEPCTGNTMTSQFYRVVEYWHRHDRRFVDGTQIKDKAYYYWARDPTLETGGSREGGSGPLFEA